MRIVLFAFILLLFSVPIHADIQATPLAKSYNIGDSIAAAASVSHDSDMQGLLRFTISCPATELTYYITPVEIQGGFRAQVNAPAIKATQNMAGECAIEYSLLDESNSEIERSSSSDFIVSSGLNILLLTDNLSASPGSTKKVEGIIKNAAGESQNADIFISFAGEKYETATFNGKFIVMIPILQTQSSGAHELVITAVDKFGNRGSMSGEVEVTAIPTSLAIEASQTIFNPQETLLYSVVLRDQAGDDIAQNIPVSLKDSTGVYVFKSVAQYGAQAQYALGQFMAPGDYLLEASYEGLFDDLLITISEFPQRELSVAGSLVTIENTGNVELKEEITLIAENAQVHETVTKRPKLAPGESATIDLSSELASGTYDIYIPKSQTDLSVDGSALVGRELLASGVVIVDGRSAMKKVGSGVGSLTGYVVGADGLLVHGGWTAPSILILVVIVLTLYYSRGLWWDMLFRKKN